MKNFLKNLISLILLVVMFVSAYKIISTLLDYKKASDTYTEIRENYSPEAEDGFIESDLKNINPDYRLWLFVENTNINYPVVSYGNNDYYLFRDFLGEDSKSGTLFMDYRNNFEEDKSTVIYGHNMKNKTMFNNLELFKEKSFWNKNSLIHIYRGDYEYIYKPFSIFVAEPSFDYVRVGFNGENDFNDYINIVKKHSTFWDNNSNLTLNDKILTLSTCSYEFNDARTVLQAKLIKKKPIK
ncbi:class B sortase [Peptacetobacter sp.]|uniref:class B sortase n=1 Tax=Peptacetobacter sp. TaxID=2991975 RepID=UPI002606890B|nr:class B sortase [Peptacetobacter sp.]